MISQNVKKCSKAMVKIGPVVALVEDLALGVT